MNNGINYNDEILLEVRGLSKAYGDATIIRNINFSIAKGASVGLVGESGSGKSTTARVISGLEKATAGSVLLHGEPYVLKSGKHKKGRINMIFQDPIDSFDSHMSVYESLYEALRYNQEVSRQEAKRIVEDAIVMVELPAEYAHRRISQLSGGECQRIGIARAILSKPELLICDEVTSALDVSVQAQIVKLLAKLKEEHHYTYLFIAHDLALVACLCDKVMVMYGGQIIEQGEVHMLLSHPIHPYTQLLVACAESFEVGQEKKIRSMPNVSNEPINHDGGCTFANNCPNCTDICRRQFPSMKDFEENHQVACHLAKIE